MLFTTNVNVTVLSSRPYAYVAWIINQVNWIRIKFSSIEITEQESANLKELLNDSERQRILLEEIAKCNRNQGKGEEYQMEALEETREEMRLMKTREN